VERVRILAQDEGVERAARRMLSKVGAHLPAVEFCPYPTDRVWTRDYGPVFLVKNEVKDEPGERGIVNWRFNGWAKYKNFERDDAIPLKIGEQYGLPSWSPDVVMEGGAIDVNGQGLLLATEECLLSPVQARNPHLTREQTEQALSDYLGVDRVLWLKNGIVGDDTHGHIDDLARFVDASTVVIAAEDNPSDENYEILAENEAILARYPVRSVRLPMPEPLHFNGQRLPASYANFYIANKIVLVPTFNDPNDRLALNILAELFEHREVIGIDCTELVWGLGALHCMTQQQPA
jgi:agmatine deiminase